MPLDPSPFSPATFEFLEELAANNTKPWFDSQRKRYEQVYLEPGVALVRALAPAIRALSPHLRVSDARSGGSLMRIYRDTRFSADKSPYKVHLGIHCRHEQGEDIHAPGLYVHIGVQDSMIGVGTWHPDPKALAKIRRAIDEDSAGWVHARDDASFRARWALTGDSTSRPPAGVAKDHPLIEDLKRKDFVAMSPLTTEQILAPGFAEDVAARFSASRPFMAFLCGALGAPF